MLRYLSPYLFVSIIVFNQGVFVTCVDADIYWRDYGRTIPSDAFPSGHGTYIAIVIFNGGLIPATLYPHLYMAVSEGPNGRVEFRDNIKILCTSRPESLTWEPVSVDQLNLTFLKKCIPGGYEDGSKLYIGKVFHEEEWKIGKVFPITSEWKGLRVWWNSGQTYTPQYFEVLMVATPNVTVSIN
nr:uncharacterized protein LOC111420334 [Onthophagus taurus]